MTSINSVDLGEVTSETSSKASNLFNMPIPLSDSDATLLMDLMGTTRTITITGYKTGLVADLRTFVSNIETLQNGKQSGMIFVSSWTNSNKTCLIENFEHTKDQADENKINYTLVLQEGTAL